LSETVTNDPLDAGIISDILNSFLGAAYGAYLGIITTTYFKLEFMLILFFVTLLALCGAICVRKGSVLMGMLAFSLIWGIDIFLSLILEQSVSPAIIFSALLATLWISFFHPKVFNWMIGRRS